ncbi:MAG: hydroxymethylbilane synthase [Leptonema sp. (in: bacteria)]
MKKIRIGTRGSHLALAQTEFVADLLENLGYSTEIKIIKTTGDINLLSFSEIISKGDEAKGLFTKEIEESLRKKEIDIAVHSLKDLPTKSSHELTIAALPQRLDFRDHWIFLKEKQIQNDFPYIRNDGIVGTSSFRRKSLIRFLYPSLRFMDIRGNVPTRIKKLFGENSPDAIILSGAGLERLKYKTNWIEKEILDKIEIVSLDSEIFPPAPGQGTLAIQCRTEDEELISILKTIHNQEIEELVSIERKILSKLEGGCNLPLGIYANKENSLYSIKLFLGEEYPYAKKKKNFYIKRYHKDSNQLIHFVYEELTRELPIVIFGKKEKNQKLKEIFKRNYQKNRLIFFDIMEILYYDHLIKKVIKPSRNSTYMIYCIFSAEGIRSLKKSDFTFPDSNFFIFLNGTKSKEVLQENFLGIPESRIFLSEDGTSKGMAKTILKKFSPNSVQIIAISGKESREEFYEMLNDFSIEQWIGYETKLRTLTQSEIQEIPLEAYLLFGSPSIFDAFYKSFESNLEEISKQWRFITLGNTTFEHILSYHLPVYAKSLKPDYEFFLNEFL